MELKSKRKKSSPRKARSWGQTIQKVKEGKLVSRRVRSLPLLLKVSVMIVQEITKRKRHYAQNSECSEIKHMLAFLEDKRLTSTQTNAEFMRELKEYLTGNSGPNCTRIDYLYRFLSEHNVWGIRL